MNREEFSKRVHRLEHVEGATLRIGTVALYVGAGLLGTVPIFTAEIGSI